MPIILEKNDYNTYKSDTAVLIGYDNGRKAMYKIKKEIFATEKAQILYEHWHNLTWCSLKRTPVNNKCTCGSNIKYKKCCKKMDDECQNILYKMHYTDHSHLHAFKNGICEMPIELPMLESNNVLKVVQNAIGK